MSFIYSLIARDPDIVLCEYTEYTGNFMQIARLILQKGVKQNTKYIINRNTGNTVPAGVAYSYYTWRASYCGSRNCSVQTFQEEFRKK